MILLTDDLTSVKPQTTGRVLVIHHKSQSPPWSWPAVEFGRFREEPRACLGDAETVVFVGLSRAMTPGNRTQMCWEVLFNKARDLRRISVDEVLFRSEPWRLWFHFGLVGAPYRRFTYSYIAESRYKGWLDGVHEDNPFDLQEVLGWAQGVVSCTYSRWFAEPVVDVHELPASVHAEYAQEKAVAFDEEKTAKAIVRRLERFASAHCPERGVPADTRLWASRAPRWVATDLPVDRWRVQHLQNLIKLTNGVAWL